MKAWVEMEAPRSGETRWSRVVSSLPVRNVQDLAACSDGLTEENLKRYIRLDVQDDEAVVAEQSGEVPMIDLGKLFDPEFAEDESARTPQVCL